MQTQEFDKLMKFESAKWADALQLKPAYSTKEEIKEDIIKFEKPIPKELEFEIHRYIKNCRNQKMSERAIRRAIKRKWNIKVV